MRLLCRASSLIVFLHVGENDIGKMSCCTLANYIIDFCKAMLLPVLPPHCVIVVSQLLPFPKLLPDYKSDITVVNEMLKKQLCTPQLRLWQRRCGFWHQPTDLMSGKPWKVLFSQDGIHLTEQGNLQNYLSIRVAIIKTKGPLKKAGVSLNSTMAKPQLQSWSLLLYTMTFN